MAMTTISINIDSELKERAQAMFEALGIDLDRGINSYL